MHSGTVASERGTGVSSSRQAHLTAVLAGFSGNVFFTVEGRVGWREETY